ncbi:MAG: hypothetical protein AUJ56_06960 [Zetaproteobacteria bacterium CG1_02_49_23]|nr:MAG: hypothetical protein AUJ56_06960 [Zetaproteobacteria bacterium CG1_02_49_23]
MCICRKGATAVMLLLLFAYGSEVMAEEAMAVDSRFDKTGDHIVDAADWLKMSAKERENYARASIKALGEDPDVLLPDGVSRQGHYLQGLNQVYL